MPTVTATELALHTRQILDQVAQRGETVVIKRNQTVIAHLVPAEPIMNATQALDGMPQSLGTDDAARWLRDSRAGFEEGGRDPWA
ncbi:type II toxin-antitoxin system Phd/YefM family antitoxin [Burkholderia cepacia]|uniref:Type II toxin-antitoxin system Phd/YefM family antitoxin n=1 Tax=Burkholderia cepacia TaxID=292 RepID=A0AAX2RAQ4_BURCE|nr:type II toxin-antitoxin system Phd/YefM family antitoxin [Burkholderia cepacia]TES96180.1 type II toxin-antitoxin system Phd/YefM family antitoxin [Burkholderia cepacia]TEU32956.1 type II toxin-antitoxin system Phd/YefM family antitoxin [Burkholderia cepacia]TEU36208.1 type II toxin-antitoxin system Phd/YefM family antitoxin [Burkholderia cepacia]TEU85101.1 type II toxin-antitoxin system Phd/YefM family antitoxin [Burkholderia cepacia]TEU95286.1 type II toxin-antitoxin system Phd/YefM famil